MSHWFSPSMLEGKFVRLEPLAVHHYPLLLEALEPDTFTYMNLDPLRDAKSLASKTVQKDINPNRLPLVTVNLTDGRVAGSTSFYLIREDAPAVEIGGTWVKKAYQGTKVNTEAKYLMFEHAFEVWKAIRVQIRTHDRNEQSKRATEKLGAVKEGVIRNESIFHDGSYRNTAMYSVIDSEWEEVKAALRGRLYDTSL